MNAAIAARVCVLTMGSVKGQPDILQMCRITMSTGMLAGCKTTCSSATSLLLQMFLSWALFYRMSFATCIVCWCDTSLTVEQGRGLQRSRGRILQRSRGVAYSGAGRGLQRSRGRGLQWIRGRGLLVVPARCSWLHPGCVVVGSVQMFLRDQTTLNNTTFTGCTKGP